VSGVELDTRAKRAAAEDLHHETQLFAPRPITFLRPLPNAAKKRWKSDPSSTEGRCLFPTTSAVSNRWGPMNGAQENRDPARWAACQKVPRAPRLTNCSPPATVTVATQPRDDDGHVVIASSLCERRIMEKHVY
jgi:hypothetical protein